MAELAWGGAQRDISVTAQESMPQISTGSLAIVRRYDGAPPSYLQPSFEVPTLSPGHVVAF